MFAFHCMFTFLNLSLCFCLRLYGLPDCLCSRAWSFHFEPSRSLVLSLVVTEAGGRKGKQGRGVGTFGAGAACVLCLNHAAGLCWLISWEDRKLMSVCHCFSDIGPLWKASWSFKQRLAGCHHYKCKNVTPLFIFLLATLFIILLSTLYSYVCGKAGLVHSWAGEKHLTRLLFYNCPTIFSCVTHSL